MPFFSKPSPQHLSQRMSSCMKERSITTKTRKWLSALPALAVDWHPTFMQNLSGMLLSYINLLSIYFFFLKDLQIWCCHFKTNPTNLVKIGWTPPPSKSYNYPTGLYLQCVTDKCLAQPTQSPSHALICDCKQTLPCPSWDISHWADPSCVNRPLHITQFTDDEKSSSMEKSICSAYNYFWGIQLGEEDGVEWPVVPHRAIYSAGKTSAQ